MTYRGLPVVRRGWRCQLAGFVLLAPLLNGCSGGAEDSLPPGAPFGDAAPPAETVGESPQIDPSGETPLPDAPVATPEADTPGALVGISISGRAVRVVAADRGPAIGASDATIDSTGRPEIHPAGFLAFGGLYRVGEGAFRYAAWGGSIASPSLIIDEDSSVGGLTPSVRFRLARELRVASDGTVAMIATLKGARETMAALEWTGDEVRLLAESGMPVDPSRSEHRVSAIQAISRSSAGSLFAALNDDSSITLWSNGNGALEPVVGNINSGVGTPSQIGDCNVTVGDVNRSDLTSGPVLLDSGAIVFPALLVDSPGQFACDDAEATVRYDGGVLTTIVSQNDAVPGATGWRFGRVLLQEVLSNGDVVVRGRLDNQAIGRFWSLWIFPAEGSPRLIALDGEEVELTAGVDRLSGVAGIEVNVTGVDRAVIRAIFGENPGTTALLGGTPPPSQPHASIEAPGASALSVLVDSGTTVPAPFGEASYFGSIGRPSAIRNGRVTFYGSVFDASVDERIEDGVWQVSSMDGALTRLLVETDVVDVGDRRVEALRLVAEPLGRAPDIFDIHALDDGGLIIYGQSDGPFESGGAILHLEP